jgi:hypothetical protein
VLAGRGAVAWIVSFIEPSEMLPSSPLPGWSGRHFHSENMTIGHWEIAEGAADLHEHRHEQEEVWNVVEGEVLLVVDDQEFRLGRGALPGRDWALLSASRVRQEPRTRCQHRPDEGIRRPVGSARHARCDDPACAGSRRRERGQSPPCRRHVGVARSPHVAIVSVTHPARRVARCCARQTGEVPASPRKGGSSLWHTCYYESRTHLACIMRCGARAFPHWARAGTVASHTNRRQTPEDRWRRSHTMDLRYRGARLHWH